MTTDIRLLEPKGIWNNFSDLNAVPRPSKKEEKVREFMVSFGEKLGLETIVDEIGNVIIKKPASKGMESRKGVVLQSHLDMVHQKNADTNFDFNTEGINMIIEDGWVTAKGTTLGADNGIGVATIMTILESNNIAHPALEALFTIDEETGMTGAKGLKGGYLNGEILLNLDTEDDDEIDIGCAGGIDVTAFKTYTEEAVPENSIALTVEIKGLNGGHSGMDIHKGLGNANKIINRLLFETQIFGVQIAQLKGGSLRNAIPRESFATIIIPKNKKEDFLNKAKEISTDIKKELKTIDGGLTFVFEKTTLPSTVMNANEQKLVINAIYAAHNGVYRMSPDIADLVETSNNVAKINIENGTITIDCLTRSSVESSKMDLANKLRATFELAGFKVEFAGSYPGWQPNVDSPILEILTNLYETIFNKKPGISACHAGLECGILGTNYPEMDMISFGPTIQGAHSPDEKANIASTQKFWKFLLEILKNIPEKA